MARRFQPPPMEPAEDDNKVKVDEQVVRKMLKVNPDLRKGRTTFQVKKALESGEAIGGSSADAQAPATAAPARADRPAGSELRETIDFFVSGKADKLRARLADIETHRRELAAEEQRARSDMAEQMAAFVALLDEGAVAAHGKVALSHHVDFLAQIGLTPSSLLERARAKGDKGR